MSIKVNKPGTQNPDDTAARNPSNGLEAPVSVRDSIREAIRETEDKYDKEIKAKSKDDKNNIPDSKGDSDKSDAAKGKSKPSSDNDEDKNDEDDDSTLDKNNDEKEESEEESEEKDENDTNQEEDKSDKEELKKKYKPPPGFSKASKEKFYDLPEHVLADIAKREKEVSDGFAQYGQKVHAFNELAQVISPRMDAIQRYGSTPAQTVDRLFKWMEALSGPNKEHAARELLKNFQINLGDGSNSEANASPNSEPTIHPALQNVLTEMYGKLTQVEQGTVAQRKQASEAHINGWAKDKPHFERVRGVMHDLISSGTVPLSSKDNITYEDLDLAYQKAIRLDDELFAQVQGEKEEAKRKAAAKLAAKNSSARQAELQRAKTAGSSIKPSNRSGSNGQLNGKPPKINENESVADTIRRSLHELDN